MSSHTTWHSRASANVPSSASAGRSRTGVWPPTSSRCCPGVSVNTESEPGPDRGAFTIGGERYLLENGTREHVLLARLTAGQDRELRPVFLLCGQRSITNQAAARSWRATTRG